jgi:hypothetical protein
MVPYMDTRIFLYVYFYPVITLLAATKHRLLNHDIVPYMDITIFMKRERELVVDKMAGFSGSHLMGQ